MLGKIFMRPSTLSEEFSGAAAAACSSRPQDMKNKTERPDFDAWGYDEAMSLSPGCEHAPLPTQSGQSVSLSSALRSHQELLNMNGERTALVNKDDVGGLKRTVRHRTKTLPRRANALAKLKKKCHSTNYNCRH